MQIRNNNRTASTSLPEDEHFVGSDYKGNIIMLVHNNTVKGKVLPVHNMKASREAEVAPVILNLVPDEAE
jgi:hypothetical protein